MEAEVERVSTSCAGCGLLLEAEDDYALQEMLQTHLLICNSTGVGLKTENP